MTYQTFTVRCTQDKFEAVRDCFDDVCENPKFSNRSQCWTVTTSREKFDSRTTSFRVRTDDEYSMEFANFMVARWS